MSGRIQAVAVLRAAVAAVPDDSFFRSRLAWELATARDAGEASAAEAVQLAQKCVHDAPHDPVLLDVLGIAFALRGDFPGAIQQLLGLYTQGQPYTE